jgi:hypothetical protein
VTRLSIRSIGNTFPGALSALTVAGGGVIGHQLEGLVRVEIPTNTGHVKLHEMKILGEVDSPPPSAAKPATKNRTVRAPVSITQRSAATKSHKELFSRSTCASLPHGRAVNFRGRQVIFVASRG